MGASGNQPRPPSRPAGRGQIVRGTPFLSRNHHAALARPSGAGTCLAREASRNLPSVCRGRCAVRRGETPQTRPQQSHQIGHAWLPGCSRCANTLTTESGASSRAVPGRRDVREWLAPRAAVQLPHREVQGPLVKKSVNTPTRGVTSTPGGRHRGRPAGKGSGDVTSRVAPPRPLLTLGRAPADLCRGYAYLTDTAPDGPNQRPEGRAPGRRHVVAVPGRRVVASAVEGAGWWSPLVSLSGGARLRSSTALGCRQAAWVSSARPNNRA